MLKETFVDFYFKKYFLRFDLLSHAEVIINAQSLAVTRPWAIAICDDYQLAWFLIITRQMDY